MKCHRAICHTIAVLLLAGCASPSPTRSSTGEDIEAIGSWFDHYLSAVHAEDLQGVIASYDSAAVLLPHGQPVVSGIAAVGEFEQALFDNLEMESVPYTMTVEELEVDRDLGIVRGRWVFQNDEGTFINVFRKQTDGSWRCLYSIW